MIKNIGGINYECYPLTAAQKVHIYTLNFSPTHEIVNIGSGVYLQMQLNLAALREALNRAVERCESMRMRIWKDPETGEMWQYITPYQNEYFEYYDFSAWDEGRVEEVLNKWTSQPFDTFGGKLSPFDLKTGVTDGMAKTLEPVAEYFVKHPENREALQKVLEGLTKLR